MRTSAATWQDHTDPRAAILTFQHSGSIRLYADRLTMRWDQLDVAWLDRASSTLHPSAGIHTSSSTAMNGNSSGNYSAR